MTYQAGSIGLNFTSDLRQVRRDLRDLRTEAERPIRVGGGGGSSANGGRGLSARVRGGNVRLGGGRRDMGDLLSQVGSDYLPEINRYGDNRRRARERQLAAVDRVAATFDRQARDDERQRSRSEAASAQFGLRSELSGSRMEGRRRQQALREQERVFQQLAREHQQRTRSEARRTERVDRNFDAAGLARQKADERRAARVDDAFDRAGLSAQKQAEREQARASQRLAKAQERQASAAERAAAKAEQQTRRESANADRTARRMRMLRLRADLATTDDPYQRQQIIRGVMNEVDPESAEGQRLRAMYNRSGRRGVVRGFMDRFEGISGAVFAYQQVRQAIHAVNQVSLDASGMRYGGSEERLAIAQRQAEADPFDAVRRMSGYLSPLFGKEASDLFGRPNLGGRLARWSQDSDLDRVMQARQTLTVDRARTEAAVASRHSRFEAIATSVSAAAMDIRDPFEQQRQQARDELGLGSKRRIDEIRDLDEQINTPGLSPAEMASLMVRRSRRTKDQVGESVADQKRFDALMRRIQFDEDRTTIGRFGETLALRTVNEGGTSFQAERVREETQYRRDAYGLTPGSRQFQELSELSYERTQDIDRRERNAGNLMTVDLATRHRRLDALFARSPAGADVSEIVGRTTSEALSLSQQGYSEESDQVRGLGRRELQLYRRTYLEAFRGEQVDLRDFRVDNPRDQENPTEVLKRIDDGIAELSRSFNGEGGGSGFFEKLKAILTDLVTN